MWPSASSGSSSSKNASNFPEPSRAVGAGERGMTADLAQPRQRGENRDAPLRALARVSAERVDQRAAAPQLGEIELALARRELAVAPLFDPFGQLGGDLLFQAPQQHRAQLRGEQAPRAPAGHPRGRSARRTSGGVPR